MSNDLNQWNGIGRLGRDPEVSYTPSGVGVAKFSLACGRQWTDKQSGEKQERTEWIRCVAWRKTAEIIGEYLHKGDQVFIQGRLETRKWEQDGQTRYMTEVIVDRMQMLGSKRGGGQPRAREESPAAGVPADDLNDDIPF